MPCLSRCSYKSYRSYRSYFLFEETPVISHLLIISRGFPQSLSEHSERSFYRNPITKPKKAPSMMSWISSTLAMENIGEPIPFPLL